MLVANTSAPNTSSKKAEAHRHARLHPSTKTSALLLATIFASAPSLSAALVECQRATQADFASSSFTSMMNTFDPSTKVIVRGFQKPSIKYVSAPNGRYTNEGAVPTS